MVGRNMTDKITGPLLAIFARWPEPGKAKTRLIPTHGAVGAAKVYRKLLEHTVTQARASGLKFELRVTGAEPKRFHEWLGDDLTVVDQGEGDLGEKLARVPAPNMVIGSDAPELSGEILQQAAAALAGEAAVIGPAEDGGYYLLGTRDPAPFAFADMEWSTETVCAETIARFEARGITPAMLPVLADIDTGEELARYPEFRP